MSMRLGLIVGSGFAMHRFSVLESTQRETPYGEPSSPLMRLDVAGNEVVCLARHGPDHSIAPHAVNYRANVWAIRNAGADACIGLNVVGGITPELAPGELAVPEQLIDYTWGRNSSYGDGEGGIVHIEFTEPFDTVLRGRLATAIHDCGFAVNGGTYGVTQGPRLETAAEIDRLARDGCAMVGMTAMPEAALARELSLRYAICAASVNYAAGRAPDGAAIHAQLLDSLQLGAARMQRVIETLLRAQG